MVIIYRYLFVCNRGVFTPYIAREVLYADNCMCTNCIEATGGRAAWFIHRAQNGSAETFIDPIVNSQLFEREEFIYMHCSEQNLI
jgi:hypothetical protein